MTEGELGDYLAQRVAAALAPYRVLLEAARDQPRPTPALVRAIALLPP